MSFDPYREWLQIDGRPRPPSHYELLGVSPNERDEERIRQAVSERVDRVRRYQLGPQGAVALKLIGELSEAFACLSDADERRKYDERFKQAETLVVDAAAVETIRAPEPSSPGDSFPPIVTTAPSGTHPNGREPKNAPGAPADPRLRRLLAKRAKSRTVQGPNWRPAASRKQSQHPLTILLAVTAACLIFACSSIAWKAFGNNASADNATANDKSQPAPAAADSKAAKSSRPEIRVVEFTPKSPVEGEAISVTLGPVGSDHADWTYQYRQERETQWTQLTGPACRIVQAPLGAMQLEFRALDAAGQASEVVPLLVDVAARSPASAPEPVVAANVPASPPPPANRAPAVKIVEVDPKQPLAGNDLTVQLEGEDDEPANLRYEYRQLPNENWLPAPDGKVVASQLTAGKLQLEFRAVDGAEATSPVVAQDFDVEANEYATWGTTQSIQGHRGRVTGLAFRNETSLASVGFDANVKLWSCATGEETKRFTTPTTSALSVSKNGNTIATASSEGLVDFWNLRGQRTGNCQVPMPATENVVKLPDPFDVLKNAGFPAGFPLGNGPRGTGGFQPGAEALPDNVPQGTASQLHLALDASQLFTRQGNAMTSYKLTPRMGTQRLESWIGRSATTASALTKDGKTVAVAYAATNEVVLYRTDKGEATHTLTGLIAPANCLAFGADDKFVAVGDGLGNVIAWEPETEHQLWAFKAHDDYVSSIAVAARADGAILTGGGDGKVCLLRRRDGRCLKTLSEHRAKITCAIFDSGDDRAATGDASGKIALWSGR